MEKYTAKDYSGLIGVKGISEQTLKNHFALYEGYVNNTNKLIDQIQSFIDGGKMDTPEFAEIKRRFGWEFDGMRLHEYYFESFSKSSKVFDEKSALAKKMEESFGSMENYQKDFKATASARGIGWTILYYDQKNDRLMNVWINEHNLGHLAGCVPLLPIDVFEHAYFLDYGTKKAGYIDAFIEAIDWEVIEKRFNEASK